MILELIWEIKRQKVQTTDQMKTPCIVVWLDSSVDGENWRCRELNLLWVGE